jgi:hypothetical protein
MKKLSAESAVVAILAAVLITILGAVLTLMATSVSEQEVRIIVDSEAPWVEDRKFVLAAVEEFAAVDEAVQLMSKDIAVILSKVETIETHLTGAVLAR